MIWFTRIALICVLATAHGLSPVIIIPGFGTSTLKATLQTPQAVCGNTTEMQLWPSADFATANAPCWLNNMKLRLIEDVEPGCLPMKCFNTRKYRTENTENVDVTVEGWGRTDTIEVISVGAVSVPYFQNLVSTLVANDGYVRNKSVVTAPYDFRKSPIDNRQYFTNLKLLVEQTYSNNGNQPVSLVGHSAGNLYTAYFLSSSGLTKEWKQKHIKQFISIAGLFGGAAEFQLGITSGWDQFSLGLPTPVLHVLRDAQRTYSFLQTFRPQLRAWKANEAIVTKTDGKTVKYTASDADVEKLYKDLGLSSDYEGYRKLGNNEFLTKPAQLDVPIHCLMNQNLDSPKGFTYTNFTTDPTQVSELGDGVVTLRSTMECNKYKHFTVSKVSNLTHITIVSDDSTVAYVRNLLQK